MNDRRDTASARALLKDARPRAMAALMRYFRDLDRAEEAFQEACLRALKHWPENGPPRDPIAWLVLVGRNAGIDARRKASRYTALSPDLEDADTSSLEEEISDRLEQETYQDDFLRLFFVCCHPDLPETQQIPLALRIIAGLSVEEIARAFLIRPKAMEQRITRAKRKIRDLDIPYRAPSPKERQERLGTVLSILYLIFNEGYSASGGTDGGSAHLKPEICEEAVRLTRHLCGLFPTEPEAMALLSLMLGQHSRHRARLDPEGQIILLEDQDRRLWDRTMIMEARELLEAALVARRPGPLQVQAAISATPARAETAEDTDWPEIARLYLTLEKMTPSPVVTLNRAVAVSKTEGARTALDLIVPLAAPLGGYFHFHALRGAWLRETGRADEALLAFEQAISLARTIAEASHIRGLIESIQKR